MCAIAFPLERPQDGHHEQVEMSGSTSTCCCRSEGVGVRTTVVVRGAGAAQVHPRNMTRTRRNRAFRRPRPPRVLPLNPIPAPTTVPLCHWVAPAARPLRGPASARASPFLPFRQAVNLWNGLAYAASLRQPVLLHATLHLRLSRTYTPDNPLRWQNRFFSKLNRWMRSRGLPQHFGWARECGKRKGDHLHLLVHVPCHHWKAFYGFVIHAADFDLAAPRTDEPLIMRGGSFGTWKATMWAGLARYLTKSISPHAQLDGVNIVQALGLTHERSEPMRGLRAGLSRSLNRAARQRARWRERTTLLELRAILHPHASHQKDHHHGPQERPQAA